MFSVGEPSITKELILKKYSELDLLSYFCGITKLPCKINSPFRVDNNPSLGFYYKDGHVLWTDFSNNSGGDIFMFLEKLWNKSTKETYSKIYSDMGEGNTVVLVPKVVVSTNGTSTTEDLKVRIRDWRDYDIEYWKSFGISKDWLIFADVYPIDLIFIYKKDPDAVLTFPADKLAYAYAEFKEGKTTFKVYQPLNKDGYKWYNKHDKSVISLWNKVPQIGDILCVCSSVKDALCLWANTGIPSVAIQGEGYGMSTTAVNVLKNRFKHVFIMLDNDTTGLEDGIKLSQKTGFTNVVLPKFDGGKDISDYFKVLKDRTLFKENILKLFK